MEPTRRTAWIGSEWRPPLEPSPAAPPELPDLPAEAQPPGPVEIPEPPPGGPVEVPVPPPDGC